MMPADTDHTIITETKYLRLRRVNGWEFVERRNITGIVGIVPMTDDHHVILIDQYRPPVAARVIELPAGLAGDVAGQEDEAIQTAARRELLEETGYEAKHWRRLFHAVVSPGITNEEITFFLATGLTKTADGGGDESESINVHKVPLYGFQDWLHQKEREGFKIDMKVYIAMGAAMFYRDSA